MNDDLTIPGEASRLRVMIVDDHEGVRKCLRVVLDMDDSVELVGESTNGEEALACFEALRPDVVLMDLTMPIMDGLDATRELRRRHIGARIIGLSMHDDEGQSAAMLGAGADAYLVKGGSSTELLETVRAVAERGGSPCPADGGRGI